MTVAERLWGSRASAALLLAAATAVVAVKLGAAELWTLEGRWAAICAHMLRSGDYLHPYLFGAPYYDKPLLSYWLMIGASWVVGRLNEVALRLPSAAAGVASVWLVYRLGVLRFDRTTGLIAGSLLATSYMFVFWSRVASADMLNVAGTSAAVTWYFARRERMDFVALSVFSVLVALTCLTKGLIGAAVPLLVILPDVARERRWSAFLRPAVIPAAAIALAVYVAPFVASGATQPAGYGESGLGMVFRENAVRYFEPFDHEGPVYLYLIDLPVYLLPWSLLLPFAVWEAVDGWKGRFDARRSLALGCLLVFVFLTASGSRRSYYVLPLVPFVALLVADWLARAPARIRAGAAWAAVGVFVAMLLWFGVVVPTGFRHGGEKVLARQVRAEAEKAAPWPSWRILICGAPPAVGYYFGNGSEAIEIPAADAGTLGGLVTAEPHTVVVTKRRFVESVRAQLPSARMLTEPSRLPRFLRPRQGSERDLVAFVP